MVKEITNDTIASFEKDFQDNKAMQIAANAAQENGIFKASQNTAVNTHLNPTFSVEIETG